MKAFVRVLFILIFFSGTSGLAQEIEWQKTIGGTEFDFCKYIQQAKDGGYFCGGNSSSPVSGNKTVPTKGNEDFWIVKLDSVGNILWQKDYGGISDDRCFSICSTSDGGLICGGSTISGMSGDITSWSIGPEDFLIFKLDSLGDLKWQSRIGGNGYNRLNSIVQTNDGGYICGGYSTAGVSGNKTAPSFGAEDYWVVKLDTIGNIEWDKTIGGSSHDLCNQIIQTSDGGYLCGGNSYSGIGGNKTQGNFGFFDCWMVKLDGFGNIEWQQSIGGNYEDHCSSILETDDGGFVCGGSTFSAGTGTMPGPSKGNLDSWMVKFSATGSLLWQKIIGGSIGDYLHSICKSPSNRILCAFYSTSDISGDKTEFISQEGDNWIVELDSVGNILWQNTIGGNYQDRVFSIVSTRDGGIIFNGTSDSDISFDKTEPRYGPLSYYDNWIVKLARKHCLIQGEVYVDLNTNDSLDIGDLLVKNRKLTEVQSERITYTNSFGKYSLLVVDTGLYQTFPPNLNYYSSNPISNFSYFSNTFEIDSLNDFAFQAASLVDDLCLSITPLGLFRRGRDAIYLLNFENAGTSTQSPTVVFRIFPNTSFVSSSITPSAVYPDSVVWNLPTLSLLQSGQFFVTIHLNPSLPIGSILNSYAQIFPVVNDVNPSCNNATWEVTVRGSYDPNDMLVDQDTLYSTVFPNPPFLNYIVRFQNVGNDTAFTVKILNPIDTSKLDLNTLEFVSASHPVDMRFVYHERNMEFLFNNILLPDSIVNQLGSHGFVHYKVKPKSNLQVGDSIKNFAAIYFDFNEPVITNTVKTDIVLFTGLADQISTSELFVYPNPSSQEINIQISNTQGKRISLDVYNLFGQKVKSLFDGKIMSSELKQQFDISSLNQGVYLLQYNVDGVTKSKKIIKL